MVLWDKHLYSYFQVLQNEILCGGGQGLNSRVTAGHWGGEGGTIDLRGLGEWITVSSIQRYGRPRVKVSCGFFVYYTDNNLPVLFCLLFHPEATTYLRYFVLHSPAAPGSDNLPPLFCPPFHQEAEVPLVFYSRP
ncbi:hypothetical protein RRG08_020861 [Elysia crispata]|uniref:Uncharacterized protein n=1 Tax=Elysia crispata TaxID=231223 RepID=A0AAE0XW59_9GAST|nr:hypothetical protein RRG08_020861 [Elysia crispata]